MATSPLAARLRLWESVRIRLRLRLSVHTPLVIRERKVTSQVKFSTTSAVSSRVKIRGIGVW